LGTMGLFLKRQKKGGKRGVGVGRRIARRVMTSRFKRTRDDEYGDKKGTRIKEAEGSKITSETENGETPSEQPVLKKRVSSRKTAGTSRIRGR